MGKKSGPPPPDYTAAAEKTAASNEAATTAQTWANRPEQVDPWGKVSWSTQKVIDPATGQPVTQWTQNTELDPSLQNALNSQIAVQQGRSDIANSMMGRVGQEFGSAMDWSQFGDMTQGAGATNTGATTTMDQQYGADAERQRAEANAYQSATSRLDPQWEQRQRQLETQLANQGISRNSEAYSQAMADFNRDRTDAYNQASMGAITAGGTEAQRNYAMDTGQQQQAFNQSLQANAQNYNQQQAQANYANQLRQQAINEASQRRAFSLNEMNALLSGQQVNSPTFQGFNTAGNWGGVDYSGAAQNQFNAGMQQQSASNAATGQMVGGLATAAMMFSDRRTKRAIKRIGKHPKGFGIYEYRYVGERFKRVGVMADEIKRYAPQMVKANAGGILMVDYSQL